eukprot:1804071-Pyramimonas_sp.AAC.1
MKPLWTPSGPLLCPSCTVQHNPEDTPGILHFVASVPRLYSASRLDRYIPSGPPLDPFRAPHVLYSTP